MKNKGNSLAEELENVRVGLYGITVKGEEVEKLWNAMRGLENVQAAEKGIAMLVDIPKELENVRRRLYDISVRGVEQVNQMYWTMFHLDCAATIAANRIVKDEEET